MKIKCSCCRVKVDFKFRYCPYCGNDLDIQFWKSEIEKYKNEYNHARQLIIFSKEMLEKKCNDTNSISNITGEKK